MADRREPSQPPSDPHPALARARGILVAEDRPVRVQLIGALLLGLVLVASGLWLWRRPSSASGASGASGVSGASGEGTASEPTDPASSAADGGSTGSGASGGRLAIGSFDAGASAPLSLSDARVLACHDRGSKKTPPDQCDHLASIEQALSSAITQAATCIPTAVGGGTIEYVADVSFARRKVSVSLPRAGRSVHDRKVLRACSTAVRGSLQGVELEGLSHEHSRYQIAVTATYRGSGTGG